MEDITPRLLTVRELAALLRVTQQTIYNHLWAGRIPGARRFGKKLWRIDAATFLASHHL